MPASRAGSAGSEQPENTGFDAPYAPLNKLRARRDERRVRADRRGQQSANYPSALFGSNDGPLSVIGVPSKLWVQCLIKRVSNGSRPLRHELIVIVTKNPKFPLATN